jgi:hypothetical protein
MRRLLTGNLMKKDIFFPGWGMQVTGHLGRCSLFLILFLTFGCRAFAQVYPDAEVDGLLKKGISQLISQDYNSAEKCFKILDEKHPSLPLGKIYLAASLIAEAYDKALPYDGEKIEKLLNSSVEQSEKLVDKDKSNVWNLYFLALAKGYEAYYKALNDSWLPAFPALRSALMLTGHSMKLILHWGLTNTGGAEKPSTSTGCRL